MTVKQSFGSLPLVSDLVELPRVVRVLLVARFVNRLGAFSMPFLAALLVVDAGASTALAGVVVGAFGLATIPSRLVGGQVATRVGTKRAVLIGLVGTAVAQLVISAAQTLSAALAGAVLLGLCFEIYEPASQGLIAEVTPEALHPRAFGLLGAVLTAAGLVAGLLATGIGHFGLRWLFVADATTALVCFAIVLAFLPSTPVAGHAPAAKRTPWRDRRMWWLMGSGTMFATVYMQIPMALPLALSSIGHDPAQAGLLDAVSAGVVIAAQPLLRRTGSSAQRLTVGYVLLGVGLALAGMLPSIGGYIGAVIIIGIGDMLLLGYSYTLVARIAPPDAKATYFAAFGITWGIALTIGPPLMGWLFQGGPATFWLTCAAVMLATGMIQLRVARRLTAQTAPQESAPTSTARCP